MSFKLSMDSRDPGQRRSPRWVYLLLAAAVIGAVVFAGWKTFWFLTDDAYISFRYISNSILGRGYTWNPPPFLPVEGYTNFLWILLLEAVWRVTGLTPPESANYVTLAFSLGTLGIGALIGARMNLTGPAARYRYPLLFLALLGTALNRSFLAWTSSGLETAMFNFLVSAWVFLMLYGFRDKRAWLFSVSAAAFLIYLTRPDGMLFVMGVIVAAAAGAAGGHFSARRLLYGFPLLGVAVHMAWRHSYYGAWLPNTYYAKLVSAWPKAGVIYSLSFVMEYTLWIWLFLAFYWVAKRAREAAGEASGGVIEIPVRHVAGIGVLLLHYCYYTFIIGGDHFEYRVYSHLVLLLFLSGMWLADRLAASAATAVTVVALSVILSLPIPWAHWTATHDLETRPETLLMAMPVSGYFPWPVNGYVNAFDVLQYWLADHFICNRHQEHKVFHRLQLAINPTREEGENISWEGMPVKTAANVGVPGWALPNVAIIDMYGLNDYVIARNPEMVNDVRMMAHDRTPPIGYYREFRPNVAVRVGNDGAVAVTVKKRRKPLTDADVVAAEKKWRAWADAKMAGAPDLLTYKGNILTTD